VAGVDSYSLAAQTVSGWQASLTSYFPAPHFEHTRSEVELGGTLSVSPDLHCAQGAQATAFKTLLNVPVAQALQARSPSLDGCVDTHDPAPQTVSGAQTRSRSVAGGSFSYSASEHSVSFWHDVPSSYSVSVQSRSGFDGRPDVPPVVAVPAAGIPELPLEPSVVTPPAPPAPPTEG